MGKYTAFRHKLPAFMQSAEGAGLSAWFAKVDEWKQAFLQADNPEDVSPAMIARNYADRDALKRKLEDQISELNIQLEALSQLGVEALESSGMQKVDLSVGGYVSIKDTPYTSTEDKTKMIAWFKRNKMNDLLTVNYQTLSGLNNERLVAGKPLIPGTKIYMKTKLTVRGIGKSGDTE
jgi:hypothetical protein